MKKLIPKKEKGEPPKKIENKLPDKIEPRYMGNGVSTIDSRDSILNELIEWAKAVTESLNTLNQQLEK